MNKKDNNYAFIDSQNLYMGIKELGWNMDWKSFRLYLAETYSITKAYLFIGYVEDNDKLYEQLKSQDYDLCFKKIVKNKDGSLKGNVDAHLVFKAMLDFKSFNRAVIVFSDGDFDCLVDHLYKQRKLAAVLSPHVKLCSVLLRKAAREKMRFFKCLKIQISLY